MVPEKKQVLVLTADAGFGHRSAANAIVAGITKKYGDQVQVDICNPLNDAKTPLILKESQSDYDRVVKQAPELYRLGYEASDASIPKTLMESVLTVLLFEAIRDTIRKYEPEVIISTYPLYLAPLDAVLSLNRRRIPVISVVTDLASVHQIWFNKEVDLCVVPNSIVKNLAYRNGLKASQIEDFGIPVHPDFSSMTSDKSVLRKKLGWHQVSPTIVVVGSKRTEQITQKLNILNHSGFDFQLILVAGKDQVLFEEFNKIEWHHPTKIYEYVGNMPQFLSASDLNICKAGGLIVTESLASGLPMLLTDVIPGQEVGNAKTVEDFNAGYLIRSDEDFIEKIYHLFEDDFQKLKEMQQNAKNVGKPEAAFRIAEAAWKMADYGRIELEKPKEKQKRLLDLLKTFQIKP